MTKLHNFLTSLSSIYNYITISSQSDVWLGRDNNEEFGSFVVKSLRHELKDYQKAGIFDINGYQSKWNSS